MVEKANADAINMTAGIVAAYVENNLVAVADLPALIKSVHDALIGVGNPEASPVETVPKATAAQIRKSITQEALISFEDGKPYRTLKRHLSTMGLTVEEYKTKWGLPKDYPMVAPSYSEQRSAMAKALGLGTGGRGGNRKVEQAPKPAAKGKASAK